ncbi:MAG: FliM/FliN family flagellar motor switch protein [Planctomycetota bacterium]|jgi:flagellar motor switch protein FliN/FliY
MPAGIEAILALEVPVIVQIAERMMPVEDVVSMSPGAIMELPKSANADLEILVNNKIIGMGTAVKVGENFGVRISYVGDLSHRLSAMGGEADPGVAEAPEPEPDDEPDSTDPAPEG